MNTLTRKKKLHKQLFLIQIIFSILKKECYVHNFFTTLSQQIISDRLLRVVIVDQKVI